MSHHWFFHQRIDGRMLWQPFSIIDSSALESAFISRDPKRNIVPTDGGRYDVDILQRHRNSVYWESEPTEVRRCSWFYKTTGSGRYVPYEEGIARKLEVNFLYRN